MKTSGDWQPIETAPKDPTGEERLLVFSPMRGIVIARYSGWGGGTGPFEYLTEEHGDAIWADLLEATHWMPHPGATTMTNDARTGTSEVQAVANAICEAGAAWLPEPLHRMAYEDMARAAIQVIEADLAERGAFKR